MDTGSATIYSSILPNLSVTVMPEATDQELVVLLENGSIDVMIDTDTTSLAAEGIDVTGLRSFFGGFDSPSVSLFAIRCTTPHIVI